jgi:hypothetical protein
LYAREAAGVNVAVIPLYATVPATGVPPGPVTVNVVALTVAGFIAILKIALITWPIGTPIIALAGTELVTAGGVAPVVKVHT